MFGPRLRLRLRRCRPRFRLRRPSRPRPRCRPHRRWRPRFRPRHPHFRPRHPRFHPRHLSHPRLRRFRPRHPSHPRRRRRPLHPSRPKHPRPLRPDRRHGKRQAKPHQAMCGNYRRFVRRSSRPDNTRFRSRRREPLAGHSSSRRLCTTTRPTPRTRPRSHPSCRRRRSTMRRTRRPPAPGDGNEGSWLTPGKLQCVRHRAPCIFAAFGPRRRRNPSDRDFAVRGYSATDDE
jgi:hypothetical protein